MEIRILGPIGIHRAKAGEIAIPGAKFATVTAILALARGQIVGDSTLADLVWGWSPPATMNAQIHTYVSGLRKLLAGEATISRRSGGYALDLGAGTVDLFRFRDLAESGRTALREGRYEQAAGLLRTALGLWRGEALANTTPMLTELEGPALGELRIAATEDRLEADLALGRHRDLIAELTDLVVRLPLHERLRAQLMVALYRSGRSADALRTYHDGRQALDEQLGVEPGPVLRDAYRTLLRGELDGSVVALPDFLRRDWLADRPGSDVA